MTKFLVLGLVPGTSFQIGFLTSLVLFLASLYTFEYYLRNKVFKTKRTIKPVRRTKTA